MYKFITSVDLQRVVYGKPELATYSYTNEVTASLMETIHNDEHLPRKVIGSATILSLKS
jgi:hypothetical protein